MKSTRLEWTQSLAFKLLATYLLAWVLTVALIGAGLWLVFQAPTSDKAFYSTERLAQGLSEMLVFDPQGRPQRLDWQDNMQWLPEALPQDFAYQVLDSGGKVHLASHATIDLPGMPQSQRYTHTVQLDRAGKVWQVQVSVSERLMALIHIGTERRMGGAALATAVLSVLLLGAVLLLTVQRVLSPLREASAQATQISTQQLSQRLAEHHLPSELQPLVQAFNQALDRLEVGFHNQQRFLANAAHELKTPLALLRGQIELGSVGHTEQMLSDVDQLARQVQQLLVLAEVSERSNFKPESIHLMPLAKDVIRFLEPLANQRGVRLDLHFEDARTMLQGDRMALFVLLKNLLENAMNYSPSGSTVTLMLRAQSLAVRDEGPGIEAAHLPHVFERFWRNPERRNEGAGLGLAICQEIANAHGWQLTARTHQAGAEFMLGFG